MDKNKYYKWLFLTGAVWNIAVGLLCIIVTIFLLDFAVPIFGMDIPPSLIWLHFYFGFVAIFGIGYYLVYRDINKNHGIVILGIMEKFLVFIIAIIYFILGDINLISLLLVSIDLLYGGLFLEFLLHFK